MNYGSPRSYDGSQGTSYSGGGYGGSGGSISPYASLGNNATSGSSGGNGWVYIWMTK